MKKYSLKIIQFIILIWINIHLGFSEINRPTDFNFDIIVQEEGASTKNLFFHTMINSHIAILDSTLNPYWLVKVGEYGLDFKVNQNSLTYFQKDSLFWIMMDQNMNEIDTLRCANGLFPDYHDIQLVDGGGYILQSYHDSYMDMSQYIPNGHPNALVKSELVIQEFDSENNLIFEWYAHEHLNIGDYSNLNIFLPEFTWMHGNSIDIDFDNNLILSNRRSDEAIKIDRYTGEVIWILGGPVNDFTFLHDIYNGFSKQHDIRRLENGNLLVFDNGTNHIPQLSRIIEYELNLETMTADVVWEYSHPEEYVGLSMGSVQRLDNGNTLINWGNVQGYGAILTEVNMEKEIMLEIVFPEGFKIYKARKFDWQFYIDLTIADLNLDSEINIVDILLMVNIILYTENSIPLLQLFKGDLNIDGEINVTDIIGIIDIILN